MEKNIAILKIIVWSFLAIFFTIIFISLSVVDDLWINIGFDEKNLDTIRTTEIDGNKIENINLYWTYGSVYITPHEGDKIVIEEKSNRNIDEGDLFKIEEDINSLNIEQPAVNIRFSFFRFRRIIKVTEIKLPMKQYNEISAKLTSGKFEIDNISTNNMEIRMTSGKTVATNVISDKIYTNMTSGSMSINGAFTDVDSRATSGLLKIESVIAPSNLAVIVTSGKATISLPENDGFTLTKIKTSGIFKSDFELDNNDKYKDGTNSYIVKMTSGKVELLRK
jgi:DUF4097 and DUF4098 domain-containing protein YvlB